MRIGYVFLPERGATDLLLAELSVQLRDEGHTLAGAVQYTSGCGAHHCDMDLRVLPDGPVLRISQNLGGASTGCRLDAGALERAVMEVAQRLTGAQLLIVNKFGKHEAEGRGFRQLIAEALSAGLPVLIGINSMNRDAFFDFVGDLAEPVAAAEAAGWARLVMAEVV